MTFEQQAALSIIDKLVIAVIVAAFAMFLNRALERYKMRSAFLAGYAEKHIAAISDAWGLMYRWENFIRQSFRYQRVYNDEQWHGLIDDLAKAIDESRRRELAVRQFVETNRFWLGEELYMLLVEYHNELEKYVRTVLYGSYHEVIGLRERLTERKQDIMSLLGVSRRALY